MCDCCQNFTKTSPLLEQFSREFTCRAKYWIAALTIFWAAVTGAPSSSKAFSYILWRNSRRSSFVFNSVQQFHLSHITLHDLLHTLEMVKVKLSECNKSRSSINKITEPEIPFMTCSSAPEGEVAALFPDFPNESPCDVLRQELPSSSAMKLFCLISLLFSRINWPLHEAALFVLDSFEGLRAAMQLWTDVHLQSSQNFNFLKET